MKVSQIMGVTICSFGLCFLGTAIFLSINSPAQYQTGFDPNKGPVNLVKDGHHEEAMAQARELLEQLRRSGWDRSKVDQRLLRLADQDYAERKVDRFPGVPSFFAGPHALSIYDERVAFYSPTYVRTTRVLSKDAVEHVALTKTEGFYIVGWKDGKVEKVPVERVRVVPYKIGGKTVGAYVFPGMKQYSDRLQSPWSSPFVAEKVGGE